MGAQPFLLLAVALVSPAWESPGCSAVSSGWLVVLGLEYHIQNMCPDTQTCHPLGAPSLARAFGTSAGLVSWPLGVCFSVLLPHRTRSSGCVGSTPGASCAAVGRPRRWHVDGREAEAAGTGRPQARPSPELWEHVPPRWAPRAGGLGGGLLPACPGWSDAAVGSSRADPPALSRTESVAPGPSFLPLLLRAAPSRPGELGGASFLGLQLPVQGALGLIPTPAPPLPQPHTPCTRPSGARRHQILPLPAVNSVCPHRVPPRSGLLAASPPGGAPSSVGCSGRAHKGAGAPDKRVCAGPLGQSCGVPWSTPSTGRPGPGVSLQRSVGTSNLVPDGPSVVETQASWGRADSRGPRTPGWRRGGRHPPLRWCGVFRFTGTRGALGHT